MPILVLLWAIGVAGATGVTLGYQLELPSKSFWSGQEPIMYCAVGTLMFLAVQETVRRVLLLRSLPAEERFQINVRAALGAAAKRCVDEFGVDWTQVGVHVFLRGRASPWARLVHRGGLRIGSRPSMFDPWWRSGKGVVGTAFAQQLAVAADWASLYRTHNADGPEKWRQRPSRERLRLSWGELQLTAEYEGIVACPVFDSAGKVIGAVTIDGPMALAQLRTPVMRTILRDLAVSVAVARSLR